MEETYGFVMSDAVSEPVDCIKFVEDILVIVLYCRGGRGLVREYSEKLSSGSMVLWRNSQNFINSCYSK